MLIANTRPHGAGGGTRRCNKVRGASLIEVLVSVVIASVGLLALAGVNASSIRYTKMSQYRGTATMLIADIAERMRANKGAGTAAELLNYGITSTFAAQTVLPGPPPVLCNTFAVACTQAQIAAFDLQTWQVVVRDQLPQGSVTISVVPGVTAADVWVAWRDPAVANADDAPTAVNECPGTLTVAADPSVRCSYFRVNL